MDKTRAAAWVAGISAVAFLGWSGLYALRPAPDAFAACRAGQVAGGAIGGAFTLTDETGARVTDADVFSRPSLVYFGYTFCPDICPYDAARNAAAVDILEEQGFDVQPVFITIDPARDTPEVLRDFTDNLHPAMLGLTGSQSDVDGAVRAFRAYGKKNEASDPEFYLMDHSTFTYLMLPGSGFADFFRREMSAEEMAERVACFIGAAP